MIQSDKPSDYVIATNEVHTVRELIEVCFQHVDIPIV
jgi:GDPmannose 4,6-dehydratase